MNEFHITHGDAEYPMLDVLVTGDLAALHYFPREGHPGFRAAGNLAGLEQWEITVFDISACGDTIGVLNDAVMPVARALAAAKEFLTSDQLPQSVEWFEL